MAWLRLDEDTPMDDRVAELVTAHGPGPAWTFVVLLCLSKRADHPDGRAIVPERVLDGLVGFDGAVAWVRELDAAGLVELVAVERGMIEWRVSNWREYQRPDTSTERTRRYRERQRERTVTSPERSRDGATSTSTNTSSAEGELPNQAQPSLQAVPSRASTREATA